MSDPFDGDPDEFFEPDEESSLGPDDPAEEYEEGTLGTSAPRAPSPEVPDVGTDSEALADYEDVDPGLRRRFWVVVLAVKFTLLSLTLGLLFLFVDGNTILGGQLLGFGLVLATYTLYRYRDTKGHFEASETPDEDESSAEATEESPGADGSDTEAHS